MTALSSAPDGAQKAQIDAWAAFGINIEADAANHWQWQETASDEDPADWLGTLSPPFSSLEACIADVEAALGPLPTHLRPVPTTITMESP